MYNPPRFASTDSALIAEIVGSHPLATLITGEEISHLPLLLEEKSPGSWVLLGHLARANPHWKALEAASSVAIFHGPQTYITPTYYRRCDVPTWNYVVAHLSGRARLLEREADTLRALRSLSAKMEGEGGWDFSVPEDLAAPGVLMKSIVGFEIPVSTMSAKLKLSQNQESEDFARVVEGLSTRKDESSRAVAAWMRRLRS